ncbi:MAG: methyltransferase domain-containing protein [Ferruginibacter sp.]
MKQLKKAIQFIKRTLTKPEGLEMDSVKPVSEFFGFDRGTPIDRYYIEHFLEQQKKFIKGVVLEISDDTYIKKFGNQVTEYEVLHFTEGNPKATIVGDLSKPETLPSNKVDCFICTQTFNFIYNFKDAIKGAYYILKPGGYLLATVAGISQISAYDFERWGDYWRFTTLSAQKVFGEVFGIENVEVNSFGNCLTAISFLRGISAEEISTEKLSVTDNNYQLVITIIAKKIESSPLL